MKNIQRASVIALLIGLVAPAAASAAEDAAYPTKPVRMVIPYPPGGGSDHVGRQMAQKLSASLGQTVIPDNRAGAAGTIGADQVAKSPPDGYTILLGGSSTMAVSPSLYEKLPFDSLRDFAAVTMLVIVPNVLVVHPSLPVSSVGDLIKLGKKRPKELNFGSQGNGSVGHLSGAMLKVLAGIDITHVPYKGASPAITALMSGEVQMLFDSPFSAMPHVKSKRLRALGVSSVKRMPIAPQLPTIAESGVPGFEAGIWYALFAPARTPRPIVDRLYRESGNALRSPDMRDMFLGQGAEIVASTPEEFSAYLKNDIARWAKIIKAAGVRAD